MKFPLSLVVLSLLLNCGSAAADNWRDDNPNQPNGYAASMYRYHHGTPDDDGPHDGYRATEIRARNGLDRFAPPSGDDSDSGSRWGGGNSSRWGGSSGSGLGRHFRQGQAEGEAYWNQRLQSMQVSRQQQNVGYGNNFHGTNYGMNNAQSSYQTAVGAGVYPVRSPQGLQVHSPQNLAPPYQNQSLQYQQPNHFTYNSQLAPMTGNCQYAPSNGAYNNGYSNSTALRHAIGQRPIGTLLRNSQGGFNKIYSE